MKKDFFQIAIVSLKHRKLRTWLTVLGIVIGVAAIVALMGVSSGLENSINDQFEIMGSGRIFVYAKNVMQSMGTEGITEDDADIIKKIPEVEWISPYLMGSREVKSGREKYFLRNIFGMDADGDIEKKFESFDVVFTKGRAFKEGERGVMILGYNIATDIFDKGVNVGEKVSIDDMDFRIIGILSEIGNPDDDQNVYIPMKDARELFEEPNKLTMIDVKIKEGIDANFVGGKIKRNLERARDDENFEVVTPDQLLEQMGSILDILTIVLGGIAAISILVGGVGIMNSTYTSVLERTKEIGVMKAIGAKNKDILWMILIESGIIGMIGGVVGIILGLLISYGVGEILKGVGFNMIKIEIEVMLIIFSLIFALGVGMLSGYFPAKKASQLKPADAIRG